MFRQLDCSKGEDCSSEETIQRTKSRLARNPPPLSSVQVCEQPNLSVPHTTRKFFSFNAHHTPLIRSQRGFHMYFVDSKHHMVRSLYILIRGLTRSRMY
jgi:hypothetical protein